MAKKDPGNSTAPPPASREDRLKAALKANMARRKAQMRARAGAADANAAGKTEADKDKD